MVRLQPEVISCIEWIEFVVFVWDDVLATDVAVCVVCVIGNGVPPIQNGFYARKEKHLYKKSLSIFFFSFLLSQKEIQKLLSIPLESRKLGDVEIVVLVVVDFGGE